MQCPSISLPLKFQSENTIICGGDRSRTSKMLGIGAYKENESNNGEKKTGKVVKDARRIPEAPLYCSFIVQGKPCVFRKLRIIWNKDHVRFKFNDPKSELG